MDRHTLQLFQQGSRPTWGSASLAIERVPERPCGTVGKRQPQGPGGQRACPVLHRDLPRLPEAQHAGRDREPALQSPMVPAVLPTRQDHTTHQFRLDGFLPRRYAVAETNRSLVQRFKQLRPKSGQTMLWSMRMLMNVEAAPTTTGHPSLVRSVSHDRRRALPATTLQTTGRAIRGQVMGPKDARLDYPAQVMFKKVV